MDGLGGGGAGGGEGRHGLLEVALLEIARGCWLTQHRSTGAPDCPGPASRMATRASRVWCDPMSNDPRPTPEMCGVYAYGIHGGTDAPTR